MVEKVIRTNTGFNLRAVDADEGLIGILRMAGRRGNVRVEGICAIVRVSSSRDEVEFDKEHLFFAGSRLMLWKNYNNSALVPDLRIYCGSTSSMARDLYIVPFEELRLGLQRNEIVGKLVRAADLELPEMVAKMDRVVIKDQKAAGKAFRLFPKGIVEMAFRNQAYYRERSRGSIVEVHKIHAQRPRVLWPSRLVDPYGWSPYGK